jgi:hypothetical protein
MTEATKKPLARLSAPYGRQLAIDEMQFEGGMRLLRITIREGSRITQVELDHATAEGLLAALGTWVAN